MTNELKIIHAGKGIAPATINGVGIDWERKGQPGKITFSVAKTAALTFHEGDQVLFSSGGKKMFKGYIFDKARSGLDEKIIKVTAYDQLYYMSKNKDTYVLENKTAADTLRMICDDFGLRYGLIMPTPYLMESRVEDNAGLLDIVQKALDQTEEATRQVYTVFDDAGSIMLLNDAAMTTPFVVDATDSGDFDYKTTIAQGVYNRVKLIQEKAEGGERKVFLAQDAAKMAKWGVLQYTEKLDENESTGALKAKTMLAQMARRKRTLSIKNVKGDTRVRGGTLLTVMLGLGDMNLSAMMRVEQVQHTFYENEHTMSLRLSGGDFVV